MATFPAASNAFNPAEYKSALFWTAKWSAANGAAVFAYDGGPTKVVTPKSELARWKPSERSNRAIARLS
jgi:hypothetical protein